LKETLICKKGTSRVFGKEANEVDRDVRKMKKST